MKVLFLSLVLAASAWAEDAITLAEAPRIRTWRSLDPARKS